MTDLDRLLRIGAAAVDRARAIVLAGGPTQITAKGDRDLVSDVDLTVESALYDFLSAQTPGIGFLGEENHDTTGDTGLRWILDPVDGTANFVRGLPLCAISLGLVDGEESVLGVIDLPFLGTRYTGARGLGAHCNGTPISGSRRVRLIDGMLGIGDFAVGPDAAKVNAARQDLVRLLVPQVERLRLLGSAAIGLAWTAAGHFDGLILHSNKPWDTSAGVCIARQAGLAVLDLDGSQHTYHSSGTVAVAPALAEPVLAVIAEAGLAG